jgi:hypothetical protein
MKRRSYIYEDIIKYLLKINLVNKPFVASAIVIPTRVKVTTSFLYKHSKTNYKVNWTLFFKRIQGSKPVEFSVDLKILRVYENKFKLKLI